METSACQVCAYRISHEWYFCPNCGKVLRDKVPVISAGKQIIIYLVSFFLAPLGLGWGLKYVRSKDMNVRLIGVAAIVLTTVSIVLVLALFKSYADQYSKMLENFGIGKY